ncbi:MAG: acyltransferase [Planctomycetes bacterium]|nr:acyltransferase [Planctomycetota bacterium]
MTATGIADHPPSLPYRRDIDGLRAVSVLAVVVCHAFPEVLGGGFVGVDIFFVISGFLITGIIASGLDDGRFSLLGFYRRRMHRLLPALITVLAACLAFGQLYLMSDEFRQLGTHTLAGALFVQNLVLWSEGGYFEVAATAKPLLHLWSLAIEEQFYLAFPLILIAMRRCALPLRAGIVILGALSFACNVTLVELQPTAVFYGAGTRAWELFAGGALALIPAMSWPLSVRRLVEPLARHLTSLCGLALIGYALCALDGNLGYPGWWATVPVLGALLTIAAGPEALPGRWLLGNPTAVAIGRISYPLYLWHWPLLSLWSIVEPDDHAVSSRLILVAAAVVLAAVTQHLVERRLRFSPDWRVTTALGAALGVVAVLGLLAAHGAIPARQAGNTRDALVQRAISDWRYPGVLRPGPLVGAHQCQSAGGQGAQTLFWGDSHVEQYAPRIAALVSGNDPHGRGAIFLAGEGVPPLPGVRNRLDSARNAAFADDFRTLAERPDVDRVVIAAHWNAYFSNHFDVDALPLDSAPGRARADTLFAALVAHVAASGKRVYLVLDNPSGDEVDPHYIFKRSFGQAGVRGAGVSRTRILAQEGATRSFLAGLARPGSVIVIDALAELAVGDTCPAITADGEPIYKDNNHLRATFVRKHVHFLDATVRDGTP